MSPDLRPLSEGWRLDAEERSYLGPRGMRGANGDPARRRGRVRRSSLCMYQPSMTPPRNSVGSGEAATHPARWVLHAPCAEQSSTAREGFGTDVRS